MKRPPRCLRAWLCLSMMLIAAPVLTVEQLPAAEAWTALEKGDAARAASLFREAVDRSPRDPRLHFGAGWAAYTLGRLDAAIASLKKALEYDDRFVQAAALLAHVAYANSDIDLAIRSLEQARALRPDEGAAIGHAMAVLEGDPTPRFFHWPPLISYFSAGLLAIA